jgi:prepilin-type processing-associated H-X9-DG protein
MTDYIDPTTAVLPSGGGVGYVSGALSALSYAWNAWIVRAENSTSPTYYCNPSSIHDTAEVALAADVVTTTATGFNVTGGSDGFQDPFYEGTTGSARLCKPVFHGRHGGKGSVLWLDGHASLENAVPMPGNTAWSAGNTYGPQHPPAYYNQLHIGYLVRQQADLSSLNALYYYVYRKDCLGSNNISLFTDPSKSLWQ